MLDDGSCTICSSLQKETIVHFMQECQSYEHLRNELKCAWARVLNEAVGLGLAEDRWWHAALLGDPWLFVKSLEPADVHLLHVTDSEAINRMLQREVRDLMVSRVRVLSNWWILRDTVLKRPRRGVNGMLAMTSDSTCA